MAAEKKVAKTKAVEKKVAKAIDAEKKVVKETPSTRRRPALMCDSETLVTVLHKVVSGHVLSANLQNNVLLQRIPASAVPIVATSETAMDVDQQTKSSVAISVKRTQPTAESGIVRNLLLRVECTSVCWFALVYERQENLFDVKDLTHAREAAELLISRADHYDRRTLDALVAKAYYYLALVYERQGKLNELSSYLNSRLGTATLRHLNESQATLIFTLLRCYLINDQYKSAAKLVSKVTFPEGANNNDLARYLYYQGRIKALQLDYTAAAGYFMQARRQAPQEAAIGFKQNAQKWVVVIGLLQGEIPERSIFRQPIYRKCLTAYLELTQAVHIGDLVHFNKVLQQHGSTFEKDETLTLIVRLRQNVIKTAVKQIPLAYSRITIAVAKAITDGAIDAVITSDSKGGERYMLSCETADVYRTTEPQAHFDTRIKYCLELHNQAVKALRFSHKNKVEVESKSELEYAKEMAEEDEDGY